MFDEGNAGGEKQSGVPLAAGGGLSHWRQLDDSVAIAAFVCQRGSLSSALEIPPNHLTGNQSSEIVDWDQCYGGLRRNKHRIIYFIVENK